MASAGFLLLSVLFSHAARGDDAAPEKAADQSASPYFYLPGGDPALDALPLKATSVDVRIAGIIADVTVTQTYKNEGSRPIEAQYVFPGSTRAAAHAMTVRLGERLIEAEIREKQKARQEYDQAKQAGKTAALLEQQRPNVFQMQVANILPGDEVRVELHYTELLDMRDNRYQFVFPTVVGPRYNTSAEETWAAQPTLPAGESAPSTFDLHVSLDTPISIKEIASASHKIELRRNGERHADIRIDPHSADANTRDFLLDYRLAGDAIESGVMLVRGHGEQAENFFLALVQPPQAAPASLITPREYIFVLDVSGSMHGFPLDTAKLLLNELICNLRPSDTFNVLLFSGSNAFLHKQPVAATRANIDQALKLISQPQGRGGTELIPALRSVYAQAKPQDVSRTIVVLTDGYVTVEDEAFRLIRKNLDRANLFAFGIGSSVNRLLIEGMARAGMGEPFVVTDPAEAPATAVRFRQMIDSPLLTSVHAQFEGVQVYDVVPETLPDVFAQRPVLLFGKWREENTDDRRDAPKAAQPTRGAASVGANAKPLQLTITGRRADGPYHKTLPLIEAIGNDNIVEALRHLWARQRIAELSDRETLVGSDNLLRQEITKLGLQYSLLTQYTSFIAVDQQIRNPDPAASARVQQPLPMPAGVSNLAVGGAPVPSTPEPNALVALCLLLFLLALLARNAASRKLECKRSEAGAQ